jgi:hypothetical protein
MAEWAKQHARGERAVILFVSDGGDDDPTLSSLRNLPRLGVERCALLTLAVGEHFPTRVVVQHLRPAYHTMEDEVPLVFPLVEVSSPPAVNQKRACAEYEGRRWATLRRSARASWPRWRGWCGSCRPRAWRAAC